MRTISTDFINQIDTERILTSARAVLRANRLKFDTERDISHTDSIGVNGSLYGAYDAAVVTADTRYTNPILRVSVQKSVDTYYLIYQYITAPRADVTVWNHWVVTTKTINPRCKPAVFNNRVFYQRADNNACVWTDYNYTTDTFGSEHTIYTADNGDDAVLFAPPRTSGVYIKTNKRFSNDWDRGYLDYWYNLDTTPVQMHCPSISYGDLGADDRGYAIGFDAVEAPSGIDYIFFASDHLARAEYITRDGSHWNSIQHVINLDLVNTGTSFVPEYATVINGLIFLTFQIVHVDGVSFKAYTIGPEPFTLGRDLFIVDASGVNYGKLFQLSDGSADQEIYYLGPGTCYVSKSVSYTGAQNTATNYLDTGNIDNIIINVDRSNPSVFQLYIGGTSVDSALITPGNELDLYASLGGYEAKLGSFAIDAVSIDKSKDGSFKSITGRGNAGKRLSQWTSDAYYDIWSQTKQHSSVSSLGSLIRMQGLWNNNGTLSELNVEGIACSAMKSSRGSLARIKYKATTNETDYTPEVGLYSNLSSYVDDNGDKQIVGILCKIDPDFCYLYHIHPDNSLNLIDAETFAMPNNTWAWLEMEYLDGLITVRHRLDSATSWTPITAAYFEEDGFDPYCTNLRDESGRPGIMVKNITPYSTTPGFASDDTVIPVSWNTVFTTPCTIIVNEEQIQVSGKSTISTLQYENNRTASTGITFMNAPHDNDYWIDGVVMSLPIGDTEADQPFCSASTNKYLSNSFRPDGTITIDKIELRIKKVGGPTANVYVYLATDAWDNSSTPNMSAVLAYTSVPYTAITTNYAWITFTFATPQTITVDNYWIIVTDAAPGNTPYYNASNYFVLSVNEDLVYGEGCFFLWDGVDPHWAPRNPIAKPSYRIIGEGNSGDGYEIYFDGTSDALARTYFDDCAMVIVDGAGKGSVFRITDYDYQAPSQWVPSQLYTPPDRWQDHVGDLNHGSWVTPSLHRIFVDRDPSGLLGEGSVVSIYPSLIVSQRGANSTIATSHSLGIASKYTSTSVQCDQFEYFSIELDRRLEDMVTELSRKAGVLPALTAEKEINDTITKSTTGYEILYGPVDHQNPIIKLTMPISGNPVSIHFNYTYSEGSYTHGKYFSISTSGISLYDYQDTLVMSWAPSTYPSTGWITVSIQNEYYCIWYGNKIVATYYDAYSNSTLGKYSYISASAPVSFDIDWSKSDRRIDNFTLDAGSRGDQLLSQLINKKRFYWVDTMDGGLKFYANGDTISGTYQLSALAGIRTSEQDLVTRICVEGLYEKEIYNATAMRDYGNIYSRINIEDCDTMYESIQEANKILTDYLEHYGYHSLIGAADPRIEPMDIITYNVGGSDTNMRVNAITTTISLEGDIPVFDMRIEGYNAN